MSTLYLVQIPHTAATSLRLAACRHWGSSTIVRDHGDGNRHTTPVVEELVHLEKDHHQFKEYLEAEGIALLTSSLPLGNLRRIFPASNIITFVSDPLTRLLKAFQKEYPDKFNEESFLKFCERVENQNLQHRYLKALPLELYGFVGISEHYASSLDILNNEFDCQLTELEQPATETTGNKKTKNKLARTAAYKKKLSKSTMHRILDLNSLDTELYESASKLFEIRKRLSAEKIDFTHGRVSHLSSEKISGWAVSTQDHTPCKVRVVVNQECVAVASAREYMGALKERNVSRDGYVGFSCRFSKKLKPSDVVSCYVHPTDQLLAGPTKIGKDD